MTLTHNETLSPALIDEASEMDRGHDQNLFSLGKIPLTLCALSPFRISLAS
jgi:hypothetical protein